VNIALCGTHGIGKTTLLGDVWQRYASTDRQSVLGTKLSEAARTVASSLSLRSLADIQLWTKQEREYFQWLVMMNQVATERQAEYTYGGYLSDRSVADNLAYIMYYQCSPNMVNSVRSFCMSHVETYDVLFYMPIPVQMHPDSLQDGFRMTSLDSVEAVDDILYALLKDFGELTNVVELSFDRCRWVDEVCEIIDNFA